jgi:sigma-B regulation protein RsbU (phosphoserine phosphatase)
MKEQILLPPNDVPSRKFWKPWKWIGLAAYGAALLFHRWLPGPFVAAAYLYGIVVIACLIFFVFRYLKDRFFWRVRNRLIGSFIFVGIIPLLILLGVVALSGYILLGHLAGQYLNQALQENCREVAGINEELAGQVSRADTIGTFPAKAAAVFAEHSSQFPRLAARLLQNLPDGTLHAISKHDPLKILPDISVHPGNKWRGKASSFEGLFTDKGRILLASLRPVPGLAGFHLEIVAPLDDFLEDRLQRENSVYVNFFAEKDADINITDNGARVKIQGAKGERNIEAEKRVNQQLKEQDARRKGDSRTMVIWYLPVQGRIYESGKEDTDIYAIFRAPQAAVLKAYFGQDNQQSQSLLQVVYVLAGMFLFAELVSLMIGFTISRRITRSVHDVYQGILALQKGDLSHKIPVRRNDQLGLLAHSFNHMTASIERLLEEVVEKKRLEQELEIAREVQATLFPKQLPHPPGMTVFGGCKAARTVSGDYYDFIVEDETHLNIVVGDISGKGISAALLMANLQAAMRSQLLAHKNEDAASIGQSLAAVMTHLNRQIYLNSPPEKYATLFLSRYDADARRLWYCNAGHPPPIVLDAQGIRTLEATGTVVGLLPDAVYQAKCIDLTPGTLLAIFTDGVTEAVNGADVEFGDKQLLEALQQSRARAPEAIWDHVLSKVGEWQGGLPQHDDITLIVAKAG